MRAALFLLVALAWASALACNSAREKPGGALATDTYGSMERMSSEQTHSNSPKEETEDLLNKLMPFAKQMLEQHGEFFPFGAAMLRDGRITAVAYEGNGDHPPSQEVIDGILAGFRKNAKLGTYRAVGIAYVISTVAPGTTEKTDAIAVRLDHVTGYSVEVVFPYRIPSKGVVEVAELFATPGPGDVFSSK